MIEQPDLHIAMSDSKAADAAPVVQRRQSFHGTPELLTQLLVRHIHRPSQIEYPEDKHAVMDRDKLAPVMAFWQEAVEVQPNLAFPESTLTACSQSHV